MKQQNTEKLSDKAFVRLTLTSVLAILICIVCLCSTTYAWFTDSVQGDNSTIQAASECLLSVSVYDKDGAEVVSTSAANESGETLELAQGTYTVTLSLPKESASGYLVIAAGEQNYYSDYLQRNDESDRTATFTLNVQTAQAVTFSARWGIYSGACHVQSGGELNVG